MNYTLHQLQIFLKVSQLQSITKAAIELNLTQPAVSIQLRNFQDQFEIPLTEVLGRQLYITEFGKEIAVAAEKIINEVYAINYKTLAHRGQMTGRLKLSIVSTGKYVMPHFLSDFLQKYPGVELNMDVTNKSLVTKSLENNEVDFSLVSILPEKMALESISLLPNKLFLVADSGKKYPKKLYGNEIFDDLSLIFRETGSGTRLAMEQYFDKHNLKKIKKMELTSNEAVKQAVIAGLGCSVMPLIGIKNELKAGDLQIIPVKGFPIGSTWQLIWPKGKNFSRVAKTFVNYITQHKDEIIHDKFEWYNSF